ncbi:acyl-CoA N-acyltransferase [Ampelomyces quisqualis]|uniref:Acyl-CoA N-acyltransferase n=1 Tax=Ampelomyces quisqualis TaxID=50730 RepID=A0A6A5QSQ6_AMPQU|nr:acyl-CoA N-acyltransferase [Ampelomyces quisqualis]
MPSARRTPAERRANCGSARWGSIVTPRLVLREFTMADIEAYYELESNEENARYQDWLPRTMDQARELVLANIQGSSACPRSTWELVVECAGRMIGRVGAASTQLEHDSSNRTTNHVDLWFSFLPAFHGKGYATEAMEVFIEVLSQGQDADVMELEIECDPRNTGSWKLAQRLGFERHSLTRRAWESKGEWVDSLVYRKVMEGGI